MEQKISGFHQDAEAHWVAELECGHNQHVRHDPPWTLRPWVLNEADRLKKIGVPLNCVRCDEMGAKVAKAVLAEIKKTLAAAYDDAGMSGLCNEGRWEAAIGSLEKMDFAAVVSRALRTGS